MIREGAQALTGVIVLAALFDGDLFLMSLIVWLAIALFLKAALPHGGEGALALIAVVILGAMSDVAVSIMSVIVWLAIALFLNAALRRKSPRDRS